MTSISPFIKWAGGKRRILKDLLPLFPTNYGKYFEPFVWGGSVFLSYLPTSWSINDINEELINTYSVVKSNPNELISFLSTLKNEKSVFEELRAWDREPDFKTKRSEIHRAGRFIFMNRTCFNWLYRVNGSWYFNVPFGKYNNPDFIQRDNITEISKYLNSNNIDITNLPYEESCIDATDWDFIYFDPPYDGHSDTSNFTAYDKDWFWKEEQRKLASFFKKKSDEGVVCILSNNDTPFIRELYKWFNIIEIQVRRSISAKSSTRWSVWEVIITNIKTWDTKQ